MTEKALMTNEHYKNTSDPKGWKVSATDFNHHKLQLAAIFTDGAVLQSSKPIPIFGWACPEDTVHIELTPTNSDRLSGSISATCQVETGGKWLGVLPPCHSGGPYSLSVRTEKECVNLKNLMIGEVWLASGQSNMAFNLADSADGATVVAESQDPLMRFYQVPQTGRIDRQAEAQACWNCCDPKTSGQMSAVAYYFAHKLRKSLSSKTAVGIIDCYIGGTSIAVWLDQETLRFCPEGQDYLDRFSRTVSGRTDEELEAQAESWQSSFDSWNKRVSGIRQAYPGISDEEITSACGQCPWPPPMTRHSKYRPTGAFSSMLERIAPYALAGILWYQGEEDGPFSSTYQTLLGLLIDRWRLLWQLPDHTISTSDSAAQKKLPFFIVQLPQWSPSQSEDQTVTDSDWPCIRKAQLSMSQARSAVHTICLIDCGEEHNLHPKDKRTPGERLAVHALHWVYGQQALPINGPSPLTPRKIDPVHLSLTMVHAAGMRFSATIPGLRHAEIAHPSDWREAGESGFEVAGPDGRFYPVAAKILPFSGKQSCVPLGQSRQPICRQDDRRIIILPLNKVRNPRWLRYAWHGWGPAPLMNDAGLPAPPFFKAISVADE